MEALRLLLFAAALAISIISLAAYLVNRSKKNDAHKNIMSRLAPLRTLSPEEQDKFFELYKIKLGEKPISVYKHSGLVEYIALTIKGSEQREFTIGSIKIAHKCIMRLEKKLKDIYFAGIAEEDSEKIKVRVEQLQSKHAGTDLVDEQQVQKKLNEILSEFSHRFEIIFLNNDVSKPAFLVRFDDWRLDD
ncbi:MAG: hypothetical protein JW904_13470 [Spirochaetales bacterium]|nr:hypothetical protein [Spirochaetales bacterium]